MNSHIKLKRFKLPPLSPFKEKLHFHHGLFGLEHCPKYVLIGESNCSFFRLEVEGNPSLAFHLMDPFVACPDYAPLITARDLLDLHLPKQEAKLILFTIVNTQETPYTINLAAPLLVHWSKRIGKQLLMPANSAHPLNI
jgi:flagellar assembly factor FliW